MNLSKIRSIATGLRASLPSYPAAQQTLLDGVALSILAECDVLEPAVAGDSHDN